MDDETNKPEANGAMKVRNAKTSLLTKEEQQRRKRQKQANRDYGRGKGVDVRGVRDKKLRTNMQKLESKYQTAITKAKDAEILLENEPGFLEPENELERTYRVRQEDITSETAVETAQKRFDLKLDQLGPYHCEYTRNGKELLLAGRKGHVATMDFREGKLGCELQLGETIRDIKWLHNNQYFAVAQKKYVYIYDRNGVELHCLKKHVEVSHMEFLPYHFLLATLGMSSNLKYQDVSTGQLVSEIHTKGGAPCSLTHNPWNAVCHIGHQNGTVTLWSPNSSEPLVKLLAHKGPVRSLAVDREGRYMVSTGQDMRMAVWDIRMFKEVNSYYTRSPASSVAISDSGLTAVGWGTNTTIWRGLFSKHRAQQEKVQSPYLTWGKEGKRVERVRWCPYEDVLGIGHDQGFSSILVPGAGEANFDALEVNPYETVKQRQEAEVKQLLNKLPPEMIALDPNFVGNLDLRSDKERKAERDLDAPAIDIETEIRNKARGRSGALKKYIRKQRKRNVIDEKKMRADEIYNELQQKNKASHEQQQEELGPALARFAKKEK